MAEAPPKQIRFGVAGALVIPLSPSEYKDFVGIGIGAFGGVSYMLSPKLALAGHLGLIYHLPKDVGGVDVTLMEIPILAGVRFMVTPKIGLAADTGFNINKFSVSEGTAPDSQNRIPLRLGADFMISGNLLAGAGLWIPNLLLRDSDVEEDMGFELYGAVGYMF
jgi:hypothetical protein